MIHLLFGKDDFRAHEALDSLKAELDGDAAGGLADSTVQVDGAGARPDDLRNICQTMPFLGSHRLVVVRGLLERFETGGRRGRRGAKAPDLGPWQAFVSDLSALPETTVLVFLSGELTPQNPLLQALRPLAEVREFKPLAQGELAGWITRNAQRYGVALEARAVAALAALVGNHLWTLDAELRKLAAYSNGAHVTEADVRSLVSLAREPSVFAMADAVIEGRPRDAADLLQRLLAEGESAGRLLGTLARQYRLLLLTKELLERGIRGPEMSARLQVQGFVVQRLLQQAPAYTIERLRQAYRKLLDADLKVKRGVFDEETALQLLLFELAPLARPARSAQAAGTRAFPGSARNLRQG